MNDVKKFVTQWSGRGYEKGETHSFWLSFLRDVFGVSEPEKFISFEVPVKLKHTSFIDAFLPDTKVIIEQKSLSENLEQEKFQSDGETLLLMNRRNATEVLCPIPCVHAGLSSAISPSF